MHECGDGVGGGSRQAHAAPDRKHAETADPVAGKTVDRSCARPVGRAGVAHAVVNTHYLGDQITAYLRRRQAMPDISFSREEAELLDTGGGVKKALPLLGERPFIVHNSDSVWHEPDLAALDTLITSWDPQIMACLLLLARTSTSLGYVGNGDFSLDEDGRVARPWEGNSVPYVFAGVSIVSPGLFAGTPDGPFSLNLTWDRAIELGRLYGVVHPGVWMHVGTPQALIDAENYLAGIPDIASR